MNLFDLIKENHPDKDVVDLCQNGGGDYNLGGMVNVAQFGSETHALLVSELIGEKPNSFQGREIHLPDSHLIARYSTEKYSFADTSENVIRSDRLVERDWEIYQAGRDPVLEWVLKLQE